MIDLLLVGIGSGNPDHLTLQAIKALNSADLILIPLTLAAAVAAWLLACWAFGFIEALTYLTVILLAVVTLYGAMRGYRGRA